jgi:hypothetical protein
VGKRGDRRQSKERTREKERQRRSTSGHRGPTGRARRVPRPDYSEVDWDSLSRQDAYVADDSDLMEMTVDAFGSALRMTECAVSLFEAVGRPDAQSEADAELSGWPG